MTTPVLPPEGGGSAAQRADSAEFPTRSSVRRAEAAAAAAASGRRGSASSVPAARRVLRSELVARRAAEHHASTTAAAVPATRSRLSVRRSVVSVTVMTVTAGLFGTVALPAFALDQDDPATSEAAAAAAVTDARVAGGQTLAVDAAVTGVDATRADWSATSQATLDAAAAAAAQALAAQQQAAQASAAAAASSSASSSASSAGTGSGSSRSMATEAIASSGSTGQAAVYQAALQYVGTPYVFGGATPAGFDCSGFVMYVYAKFGVSLPHSVGSQAALGTTISASEARPGDVVVFNDGSHDGFYAGNGMILDAPKPGGYVSVRPLWSSAVHYVRYAV
ncbi:cell wall-associated NlpC family hydrolase [Frigoribacterium sp. PhB107]|uniref:C40 family peptidase n=1 Tax=Frigoribacterium sp. PhB107 TaxID=2485172 RepID=UPI000FBCAF62|nr:C40 family peptidase [Frigoribacterium sp. PhB107]ROP75680.1 cell wall-associated NlpC family hydrolase [Frigoribacterium sp. PhB107]